MFVSLGILFFVCIITAVIGFRLGDIGRLGIIQNIEVVIIYLLDAVLLNESENYLCYIGVVITIAGCGIVFYEQRQNQNDDIRLDDGEGDDSYEFFERDQTSGSVNGISFNYSSTEAGHGIGKYGNIYGQTPSADADEAKCGLTSPQHYL